MGFSHPFSALALSVFIILLRVEVEGPVSLGCLCYYSLLGVAILRLNWVFVLLPVCPSL